MGYLLIPLLVLLALSAAVTAQTSPPVFDPDCNGLRDTDCKNFVISELEAFINAGHYSPYTLPIRNFTAFGGINVTSSLLLNSLNDINIELSMISVSAIIDLRWVDQYLRWNSSKTPGANSIHFPASKIYTPDFILYNSLVDYNTDAATSQVLIGSYGDIFWSNGPKVLNFFCKFDPKAFPYDEQTCYMRFTSFKNQVPRLVLELGSYESSESFYANSEWSVEGISASTKLENFYDLSDSLYYSISVKRYPEYYEIVAVYPCIFVTLISILSFWVRDLSSRLTLAAICLLTIVAVQLIVAGALPIAGYISWLGRLALFCIVYVTIVCFETCIAAYMLTKKGPPAVWVRYIILISLPLKCCSLIFGVSPDSEDDDEPDDISKVNQHVARTPLIDERNRDSSMNTSDVELRSLPSNVVGQADEAVVEVRRATMIPGLHTTNLEDTKTVFVSSWRRGSASLDRISRVMFPFVFIITILIFLSQRNL